jgi:hypothetical protein
MSGCVQDALEAEPAESKQPSRHQDSKKAGRPSAELKNLPPWFKDAFAAREVPLFLDTRQLPSAFSHDSVC